MTNLGGFYSYTHADDDAEFGRIKDLARDIAAQYEMLTGESIDLFLDRDSISWGNAWAEKVDASLAAVAFFIPIVTPRFFQSSECRRELRTFADRAERLGVTSLIMPILYVEFPGLYVHPQTDELITMVTKYQWEPWTELRFAERASGPYRQGVVKLAQRLVEANSEIALAAATAPLPTTVDQAVDDSPGLMDLIADAEEAFPLVGSTVERAGELLSELSEQFNDATEQMEQADARGKGFAGRLTVVRHLGQRLDASGDEMIELAEKFTSSLATVDAGIRTIFEMTAEATYEDDEEKQEVLDLFQTIEEFAVAADDGLGAAEVFLTSLEPLERSSRDLRAPLRKWRQAMTVFHEGRQISNPWIRLIAESPLQP